MMTIAILVVMKLFGYKGQFEEGVWLSSVGAVGGRTGTADGIVTLKHMEIQLEKG
jgi:hypothetical protein